MAFSPKNAALILDDGTCFLGSGVGAFGHCVGELCFNTAMTGYQEILTDPSYAGQIIIFTFPHIGNIGANSEDDEALERRDLRGVVMANRPTAPSNWRSQMDFNQWLIKSNIIGITNIDTRLLTKKIRVNGCLSANIFHLKDEVDIARNPLIRQKKDWHGLKGLDLTPSVSTLKSRQWEKQSAWQWPKGFGENNQRRFHVVAFDYGIKRNILRLMASYDCHITIMPAQSSAQDILAQKPDGIFLSNGPGDPQATSASYAFDTIQALIKSQIPIFGICLGHQLLALALGAKTHKMHQGHHGANHPIKNLSNGAVEITSMNHSFAVSRDNLPPHIEETHFSLFDNSLCGFRVKNRPIFSVQYHPEASPGPQDSHYLFKQFCDIMADYQTRKS